MGAEAHDGQRPEPVAWNRFVPDEPCVSALTQQPTQPQAAHKNGVAVV
jgi:hypothetical protein